MASVRMINTNFWKDAYVENLDPSEKLLFLYFLTNPNTNIAGIYEISLRQIAFDTGFDRDMILKILERFQKDGKFYYKNGWLAANNWIKHQAMNPKVQSGIERIIDEIPEWLHKELIEPEDPQLDLLDDNNAKPIDSLSKPIALNLTKLNLTKPNGTAEAEGFDKTIKTKAQKRSYAMAAQADRDLEARVAANHTDKPKGYSSFASAGELLRNKKLQK